MEEKVKLGSHPPRFVLIGDPVAHSLSPAMHNHLYEELGKKRVPFARWSYEAIRCPDERSARYRIDLVRTGHYRGMNITMPYKKLALQEADYVDASADAAGGANVLVRDEDYKLNAYNTDGKGAIGAIERVSGEPVAGKRVLVCGTGPTSSAIAVAAYEAGADEVHLASRKLEKARANTDRLLTSLDPRAQKHLFPAQYDAMGDLVSEVDIIIDATPVGMNGEDEAIVDVNALHEGKIVLDTVYGHGKTKLIEGAEANGALAMDGLEMLVEQAALSVEIWSREMALPLEVDRSIMRTAALHHSR